MLEMMRRIISLKIEQIVELLLEWINFLLIQNKLLRFIEATFLINSNFKLFGSQANFYFLFYSHKICILLKRTIFKKNLTHLWIMKTRLIKRKEKNIKY